MPGLPGPGGRGIGRKPRRGGRPWLTIAGGASLVGALIWLLPDIQPVATPASGPDSSLIVFWLAPLMFVAAAVAAALLGYGERGALQRSVEREE